MSFQIAKANTILFDHQTTYLTDYQKEEIKAPIHTIYKEKGRCVRIRPPPLKDVHTMTHWKTAAIPFDLLHERRDIVGTDPRIVQKANSRPPDLGRAEAQRTRPRLIMTPSVSMDDIQDPVAREILCTDMYTSNTARVQKEAVSPYFRVEAPFPGLPAPSNPISLPKYKPPVVSPEWRMESTTWDMKQLRGHCDATKEFWLRQELKKCRPCDESAVVKAHMKMAQEAKNIS